MDLFNEQRRKNNGKNVMIDELMLCNSLAGVAEMALGNKGYFDNGSPIGDLMFIIEEHLEKVIETLKEELKKED